MEEEEDRQSLPLNIDMVGQVVHGSDMNRSSLDELLESVEVMIGVNGDEFAPPVSILNGPFQAVLLSLLVVMSIGANACVINNIRHNCIKLRSTHFILIQHLCMADLIGASLILPAPLVTSFRGRWEGGPNLCHLSSVVNVSLWLQHVFMFLMLKIDRVLAATLPIGRYPICTPRTSQWLVLLAWLLALAIGAGVTSAAGARFEPSLLLCAPGLPQEFGITLISLYCSAFASMVVGYVVLLVVVGRKKSKNKAEQQSEEEVTEEPHHLEHDSPGSSNSKSSSTQQQQSGANLRSAATSLIVTASHLLLYLPALLLLGLQGTVVNPVAAALCALIVYSEFLIHPMVLLSTSRRMRQEVLRTLKRHSPCCC
ncbi:hypothetical protein GHT06_009226 [Daphnia sinensis]|uniref:G-protein coupled receptors family 1 profile domain-containing protein n=1 Tax=Daphnia sinensis TaxID=1820382 RepID=A0AAD5L547_9CRUS|nr:hypothetical protein GHT06_009226 [Daphnia sinensis]